MFKSINKAQYWVALAGGYFLLLLLLLALLPTRPSLGAPLQQGTATPSVYLPLIDPGPNAPTAQPTNQAPTVNAGVDQTITLPIAASLDGTVTDDGLPNPPATITNTWSKTSGPGTVTFTNHNTVDTNAVFSSAGAYVLRLTASDSAMTAFDEIAITVQANKNRIVFDSGRDSGTNRNVDIFVMNADGSNPVNLTNNPATDYDATWSPDGLKIAFVSDRDNQTFGESEIYVMNADGSNQTRLTNSPEFDGSPAWSSNGDKIAFTSGRDGNGEIYVMNADGSAQTRITNNTTPDRSPTWSPDGLKMAFVRDNNTIWTMNADGTGQVQLPNNTIYASDDPDWSPDGTKIAYVANHKIWVMNTDGSNRIQLTNIANRADWFPSWSADGTQIVFSSFLSGSTDDIIVINSDGTGRKNLTNHPANDSDPDWQP